MIKVYQGLARMNSRIAEVIANLALSQNGIQGSRAGTRRKGGAGALPAGQDLSARRTLGAPAAPPAPQR